MNPLLTAAVANNADWCDAVCRGQGLRTKRSSAAWSCSTRTPNFYPDAVSLGHSTTPAAVLDGVDTSAGCSIKDSFAGIDLQPHGFRVLFDARWIARPPASRPRPGHDDWTRVRSAGALGEWEAAWRCQDGPIGLFEPLLSDETVSFLVARRAGRVVAGAIAHVSSGVVGLGNVFTLDGDPSGTWAGCIAAIDRLHPESTIVGYAPVAVLAQAADQGFDPIGALRVWLRDI